MTTKLYKVRIIELVAHPADGQPVQTREVGTREVRASSIETARELIRPLVKPFGIPIRSIGVLVGGGFQVVLEADANKPKARPLPGAVWKRGAKPARR